jgi:hypothetical protein
VTIGDFVLPLEYLAVALLVLVAVAALLARRREAARHASDDTLLQEAASARGLRLSIRRSASRTTYHFTGATDEVAWELESVLVRESPDAGVPARAYSRWRSAAARLDSGVIEGWPELGRPLHQGVRLDAANAVDKLIPGTIGDALGLKKGRIPLLLGVQPVEHAPPELAGRMRFLATAGLDARPLLSESSSRAIVEYIDWSSTREGQLTPGAPLTLILLSGDGLTLLTHGAAADPEVVERIARLGSALASGYRPSVPVTEPLRD